MQAGRLRTRGVIQSSTEAPNAHGQVVHTWSTLDTRWMDIVPAGANEDMQAQHHEGLITHRGTMRHYAALRHYHRITHDEITYNLDSVTHDRTSKEWATRFTAQVVET